MPQDSTPELLVLHTVRVTGMADVTTVARRAGLDRDTVDELLRDDEAYGWVAFASFGGTSGWALTERGRAQDSTRLADELDRYGVRGVVGRGHATFESLNGRLVRACTAWQLQPSPDDPLAANDHADPAWDAGVLDELAALGVELTALVGELAAALARFTGYDERFAAALAHARAGRRQWVTGIEVDSCHHVWMELHEDLLSTLGIERGAGTG